MSAVMAEIDLSVDFKTLSAPAPKAGDPRAAAVQPDGSGTFTTTCWTCGVSCGTCTDTCACTPECT
ncbi:MAG: hypothetical protein HOV87_09030 [Catenulispora sp.]|nr:hypothetical protein [Catenulispora sp.]